uniref:Uncharacterized protein n=1 Tax=Cyanoderma ruficeps TaxID=181631 RepID=A0A8C3XAW0_9PASS
MTQGWAGLPPRSLSPPLPPLLFLLLFFLFFLLAAGPEAIPMKSHHPISTIVRSLIPDPAWSPHLQEPVPAPETEEKSPSSWTEQRNTQHSHTSPLHSPANPKEFLQPRSRSRKEVLEGSAPSQCCLNTVVFAVLLFFFPSLKWTNPN